MRREMADLERKHKEGEEGRWEGEEGYGGGREEMVHEEGEVDKEV